MLSELYLVIQSKKVAFRDLVDSDNFGNNREAPAAKFRQGQAASCTQLNSTLYTYTRFIHPQSNSALYNRNIHNHYCLKVNNDEDC